MVSFENFVKSMQRSLLELKVIPSFCFAFNFADDVTAFVLGADEYLERVEGQIRKCLFFYIKIF